MLAIGITSLLIFACLIAWACATIDASMYYSESNAWHKAQVRALRREAERAETMERVRVRARDHIGAACFAARHTYMLARLASLDKARTKRSNRSSSGTTTRPALVDNSVNSLNSALELASIARKAAQSIGIRLRPTSQAVRHAYIRACNRAGLEHSVVVTIDNMLQS